MEKPVRIASEEVAKAPGREEKPLSPTGPPGFRAGSSPDAAFPLLLVSGDEDRSERFARLSHAYRVMCSLVAVTWPGEVTARRDADAVSWTGAIASLQEDQDELTVTWRDEDHLDKFRLVAELAWSGLCESGRPVVHGNADPDGILPARQEVLF